MRLVFAKTEYAYDSYRDFWRLVELAGFETCYVKDVELSEDAVYVTTPMNGELPPHMDYRRSILRGPQRAKVVWWNIERPDSGVYTFDEVKRGAVNSLKGGDGRSVFDYVDQVWVSDRHYAGALADPRVLHVVLGGDARLVHCEETYVGPPQYDWAHMSYENGRRTPVYAALRQRGLLEAPNAWGATRDAALRRSRLMVNVHQTPAPILSPLRFALAAAYALPMVSEELADPYPLVAGEDYLSSDYAAMADSVSWALGPAELHGLARLGQNLRGRLCAEWTFRNGVEDGLRRSGL